MQSSKIFLYLFIGLILSVIYSCSDVKESDIKPEESFNKIYNSQDPEQNVYPIDIVQNNTKGYFIVNEVDERSVKVIKLDEKGDVLDQQLFSTLKNPLPGIFKIDSNFYFFCRDELDYTIVVKIDNDTLSNSEQQYIPINFPLAVGRSSKDEFLVQSWNQEDRQTIVTKLDKSFGVIKSQGFNIEEDVEPFLINHLLRKGPKLPFLIGESGNGQYYVNGYNNYNFNLLFLNDKLEITGEVAGFKTERYVTSLQSVASNKFAVTITATAEDKNYLSSNTDINIRNQAVVSNIKTNYIPEMSLEIPLTFKKITANAKENILCAFTTKTKQVALYSYDMETGVLNGKHLLGYTNPYEFCSINITEDGGIVVLSKTQVAGRFPRIAVTKFSKEEVNNLFGR